MDFSTIYSIYSDAVSSGKLAVLKVFLDTLKGNPLLAIFVIWLLLRNIRKTVTAFIKYSV